MHLCVLTYFCTKPLLYLVLKFQAQDCWWSLSHCSFCTVGVPDWNALRQGSQEWGTAFWEMKKVSLEEELGEALSPCKGEQPLSEPRHRKTSQAALACGFFETNLDL